MARKHPHKPWFHKKRAWPRDDSGEPIEFASRRQHKLMKHVQIMPSAVASAKKRAKLYANSVYGRRDA